MNQCKDCQCTDRRACEGGCFWVLPNVCSRCYLTIYLQVAMAAGDSITDQAARELGDGIALLDEDQPKPGNIWTRVKDKQ